MLGMTMEESLLREDLVAKSIRNPYYLRIELTTAVPRLTGSEIFLNSEKINEETFGRFK